MASNPDIPSRPQASTKVQFTERQLREVALACFANAQEFYEEACILLERGHVRSLALGILGAEEFAKAIVFTVAALRPDEHALLAKALFREKRKNLELFRHEVKHKVTEVIDMALITAEYGIDAVEWTAGFPMDARERLHERLSQVAAYGLTTLIPSPVGRQAQARARDEDEYGPSQNTLKNLALYVELDRQGNILAPCQLAKYQSRSQILGLKYFLENFALLPEALQDDEQWQKLSSSIRSSLTSRTSRNDPPPTETA